MRYYLGADLGATKTHTLIVDETGRALGFGESGPANHESVGYEGMFQSMHDGLEQALRSAGRFLKETQCQAVKLEGGRRSAATIRALVDAGIPVMGHIGLTPQSVRRFGGYKVQRDADELLADSRAAADAGAFALVLECVPAAAAARITAELPIPTIGIGAGPHCDGQNLVLHDMVGLFDRFTPKFVKKYADCWSVIGKALTDFQEDVRKGEFPKAEHSFTMKEEEYQALLKQLGSA